MGGWSWLRRPTQPEAENNEESATGGTTADTVATAATAAATTAPDGAAPRAPAGRRPPARPWSTRYLPAHRPPSAPVSGAGNRGDRRGPLPPQTRFEFERWLGHGILGRTYLGVDEGGARVAVTRVRGHWWRPQPQQEVLARTVERLTRARIGNAVRVLGWGFDQEQQLWVATEYVDQPSLEQVVRHHGRLPPEMVLGLVVTVGQTLARLAELGLVHGNLKPSNIFCFPYGPVVADYHLLPALARAEAEHGARHRQSPVFRCAPAFTAPEVLADVCAAGPAGDVFSLACVAVYAATGGAEYPQDPTRTLAELARAGRRLAAPPWGLRRLLTPCLSPARDRRPTPAALADAARRHGSRRYGRDWWDDLERSRWSELVRELNEQRVALAALSRSGEEREQPRVAGGPGGQPHSDDGPPG